jgi:replication factor C large subunit
MTPWIKKYQPKKCSEIIGQEQAILKINASLSTKKPILLYGPTGTGKTSAIYAITKEKKWDVFEINSSDQRNKKGIEALLSNTIVQQSLFSRGKIILIDDIDALSGRRDRGGIPTIMSLFPKTKFPIVFTCTDPWSDKLSKLRRKCTMIEFVPIKKQDMQNYLKFICMEEAIKHNDEDLVLLTKSSNGDLRASLNDLQTHSINNTLVLDDQGERNRHEDIHYCLRKILKSRKWEETYNIFNKVDIDTKECFLWLDENIPSEYSSKDLKKAYDRLSKADVYNGRIRRMQYWRFLVYIHTLLTAGVAFSKTETNPNFTKYQRTKRILKLWMAKQRNAKKKSICNKIALATHTSKKEAIRDTFPYLKKVLSQKNIIEELELNDDEIGWLIK